MDIITAFEVLGLPADAGSVEITRAFRQKVKKYHPDYNRDKEAWSHEMMTRLNQAYETAVRFVISAETTPGNGSGARHSRTAGAAGTAGRNDRYRSGTGTKGFERSGSDRSSRGSDAAGSAPPHPEFERLFVLASEDLLDGIYMYYQYGLENPHLRREGTHRFRYRSALRRLENGIRKMEEILPLNLSAAQRKRLSITREFGRAILSNMKIDMIHDPSTGSLESKAYRHYREGSRLLDDAIKAALFPDYFRQTGMGASFEALAVSEHEFMTVMTRYHDSHWIPETVKKLYLLNVFIRVLEDAR